MSSKRASKLACNRLQQSNRARTQKDSILGMRSTLPVLYREASDRAKCFASSTASVKLREDRLKNRTPRVCPMFFCRTDCSSSMFMHACVCVCGSTGLRAGESRSGESKQGAENVSMDSMQ